MKTVYTKDALEKCLLAGQSALVVGELAQEIRKNTQRKKWVKNAGIGGILMGLVLAPVTGGMSLGVTVTGLAATAAGVCLTLSATELAIICGLSLAALAICKGCKVKFQSDGSVIVEPKG